MLGCSPEAFRAFAERLRKAKLSVSVFGSEEALAAANAVAIAEGTLRARSPSRSLAHVQGCAHAPFPGDKGYAELEKIEQRLQKRAAAAARQRGGAPTSVGKVSGAGKVSLLGISPPALKAACKLIGVSGPQPGPYVAPTRRM